MSSEISSPPALSTRLTAEFLSAQKDSEQHRFLRGYLTEVIDRARTEYLQYRRSRLPVPETSILTDLVLPLINAELGRKNASRDPAAVYALIMNVMTKAIETRAKQEAEKAKQRAASQAPPRTAARSGRAW